MKIILSLLCTGFLPVLAVPKAYLLKDRDPFEAWIKKEVATVLT